LRVEVRIAIERVVAWPDVACAGEPLVHGVPLPDAAAPVQAAPAKGTGPRINQFRAARRAGRLPDVVLGWPGGGGVHGGPPVRGDARSKGSTRAETSVGAAACDRLAVPTHVVVAVRVDLVEARAAFDPVALPIAGADHVVSVTAVEVVVASASKDEVVAGPAA